MQGAAERILGELQSLVNEMEDSFKSGSTGEALNEASASLKDSLARARSKLEDLESRVEGGVRRGVRATHAYVQDNPWRSIGIAAAAAFLLGALVSRRDAD